MAMHTGLPIVPIGIIGMDHVQKLNDISIWKPAKIKIVIGKPISFVAIHEPTKAQLDNGIQQLMSKIAHLSGRDYVNERAQHG
jgi:1-acyl-sn-glycerol-3-phosphate acyltransferase